MRVVCFALLALLATSAFASDLFLNGYYPDRSGDIVVNDARSRLSVNAVFSSHFSAEDSMLDVEVASRVASVLAIQGAPVDLLSKTPKAHFTIAVMDLPVDASAIRIQSTQLPGSSSRAATLATLLTGQTASVHGIVGDSWFSRGKTLKHAFESSAEYPAVSQIQDVVALTNDLNGARQAVVLSASSSLLLAKALGVRPELRLRLGEAVAVVQIVDGSFSGTAVSSGLTAADVRALIAQEFPSHVMSEHPAFAALYAELAFGLNLVSGVAAAKRPMTDGALDSISIGIEGLASVGRAFGKASDEFASAAALTQAALARIRALAARAYGSEESVSSVIVSISSGEAMTALPQGLETEAVALPHIYVSEARRATVCAALNDAGIDTNCASSNKRAVMAPESTPASPAPELAPQAPPQASPVAAPSNNSAPVNATAPVAPPSPVTFDEVAMFQVVLWASVLMITTVLVVIYAFCYMDVGEDSLLYRSTSIPTRPAAAPRA